MRLSGFVVEFLAVRREFPLNIGSVLLLPKVHSPASRRFKEFLTAVECVETLGAVP
jgi:hypothetical protein